MRVLIAYPDNLTGARLAHRLASQHEILAPPIDFRDQREVEAVMRDLRPQALVLDTPYAGGIAHNLSQPADLLLDNLEAQAHAMRAAHRWDVTRLVFLGEPCMYPREGAERLSEDLLGHEPLEPSNRAYATAKLAGWRLCQAFREQHRVAWITVVPANLYGPGDDFDPSSGHVVGALLRRFHEAHAHREAEVEVWGSGRPVRDFLHADDLAAFVASCLESDLPWGECNVGSGVGCSIAELAAAVAATVGYEGAIVFDTRRPDGMPRKVLDSRRASTLGWRPRIALRDGLADTYRWFLAQPALELSANPPRTG